MGNVTGKNISLTQLCKLIDVYKRMSIDGERVDFIVYPIEDDKRVIVLKLQDGKLINEKSYLFDNGDEFDNSIYPILLSIFLSDDLLGSWRIETVEDEVFKGINETQIGNVIYLNTYNKEYFDKINDKIERKTSVQSNEDRIWDEILQYAKNKRAVSSISLKEEELDIIYRILLKYVDDNRIGYGNTIDVMANNEKYLSELFNDKERLMSEGITEDTINKINISMIKQFTRLLENEKRIRYRLDIDNPSIKDRIDFATYELAGAGFFDQKNKISQETPTIRNKMKVISKLISSLNLSNIYTEKLKDKYKGYCYEIIGYFYRKGVNSKTKEEYDYIMFQEYSLKDKEKKTNELTSKEIYEIIDYVEQEKNKAIGKDREKELFRIVKPVEEKEELYEITEIKDAYEESLNYSDDCTSWIKIMFDKDNTDEADVIILNKSGFKDLILYQRTISLNKLKGEVMNTLRSLFAKNNSIHYKAKYKLDNMNTSCLLMIGENKSAFNIINAPIDFVDDNKQKLEELMN